MWTNTQVSMLSEIKRRIIKDNKEGTIFPETWVKGCLQRLINRETDLQTILELREPEEKDEVYKGRSATLIKE